MQEGWYKNLPRQKNNLKNNQGLISQSPSQAQAHLNDQHEKPIRVPSLQI